MSDTSPPTDTAYVVGTTVARLFDPLYFYLCPANFVNRYVGRCSLPCFYYCVMVSEAALKMFRALFCTCALSPLDLLLANFLTCVYFFVLKWASATRNVCISCDAICVRRGAPSAAALGTALLHSEITFAAKIRLLQRSYHWGRSNVRYLSWKGKIFATPPSFSIYCTTIQSFSLHFLIYCLLDSQRVVRHHTVWSCFPPGLLGALDGAENGMCRLPPTIAKLVKNSILPKNKRFSFWVHLLNASAPEFLCGFLLFYLLKFSSFPIFCKFRMRSMYFCLLCRLSVIKI